MLDANEVHCEFNQLDFRYVISKNLFENNINEIVLYFYHKIIILRNINLIAILLS